MMTGRWRVLMLGLLLCSLAQAETYRWIDEQGGVHYGDRQPPPGRQGEQVELRTAPPVAASAGKKLDAGRVLKVLKEDREARQATADRRREEQADRDKRCEELKDRYGRYSNAGALYEVSEDGKRHYLSAAEKDEKLAALREQMEEICSEPVGAGSGE